MESVSLGTFSSQVAPSAPTSQTGVPSSPQDAAPPLSSARPDAMTPLPGEDAGMPDAGIAACVETGRPGAFNMAGTALGATESSTDWTWSSPFESFTWDFAVEAAPNDSILPARNGYYYAYQFSFIQGAAVIIGLQVNGWFSLDEMTGEYTRIFVFWISGPPVAAQLGEITSPNARVAQMSAAGQSWLTIHAKFDWQLCHVYRFRFAPESTDDMMRTWYGVWVTDLTTSEQTFMGRMLMPKDTGKLTPFGFSHTTPIDFGKPQSCEISGYTRVTYAPPVGDEDQLPMLHSNRFADPARCATSRFSELQSGVSHELGVPR